MGPLGDKVYAGSGDEQAILVLDAATGGLLNTIPIGATPHQIVFSE